MAVTNHFFPFKKPLYRYHKQEYGKQRIQGQLLVKKQWNSKSIADVQQNPVFYFSFRQQPHTRPCGGAYPCIPKRHRGIGKPG